MESGGDDGRTIVLWTVYVLLTVFLVCLVIASFVHYHLQNRSRYGDKRKPIKESAEVKFSHESVCPKHPPLHGSNEKHRVTLGRNGLVPGRPSFVAIDTTLPPLPAVTEEPEAESRYHQRRIEVLENPRKERHQNGLVAQVGQVLACSLPTAPQKRCRYYYVNEGYDGEPSNGDSEKSLIADASPPPPAVEVPAPRPALRTMPNLGDSVSSHWMQEQEHQQDLSRRKHKERSLHRKDTPLESSARQL